jgi:hypothetical protein
MSHRLDKRLAQLERRVGDRTKPRICNCRKTTLFHDANCLDALLRRMPRVCPLHGFRELGFFFPFPRKFSLLPEDDRFCPCSADAFKSFMLGPGPHTREGLHAALKASCKIRVADGGDARDAWAALEEYWEDRQMWVDLTRQRLPSRQELNERLRRELRKIKEMINATRQV